MGLEGVKGHSVYKVAFIDAAGPPSLVATCKVSQLCLQSSTQAIAFSQWYV